MGVCDKTTKSSTTYDPAMQGIVTGNVSDAQNLAKSVKPYTGELNAATSPLLQQYYDQIGQIGGTGQGLIDQAQGAAQSALSYDPMQVHAGQLQAANSGPAQTYDPSRALGMLGNVATAGGADRGAIRNIGVGSFDAASLAPYLNPATDQIVNAGLADNEHARLQQANYDNGKAAAAGAFGNSGFGVAKSLTNDNFQRSAGSLAANLRGKAFDSASNLLMQHLGLDLQGQQANQGADQFVVGQNAETGRFNAGQANQNSQYGAGLLNNAGIFNTGQTNAATEANTARQQAAGTTNVNNDLAAAIANQNAQGNQAQVRIQGGGLLGNLANTQVNQQLGLTGALGTAAGIQQDQSQQADNRNYAAWQQNFLNQLAAQQGVTSAVGQIPGVTNTTGTQVQSGGGLGQALGLAGTLGMALATGGASMGLQGLGAAAGGAGGLGGAGFGSFNPSLSSLGSFF